MAALGAALAFVLRRTVFGRRVTAVGSNEQAAHLSGVPVDRVKIAVYALGVIDGVIGLRRLRHREAELQVVPVPGGAAVVGTGIAAWQFFTPPPVKVSVGLSADGGAVMVGGTFQ